jgi:mono/diheme cytochrome c family protein
VAFGLYVPGSGATVTRANARAAIERGRVQNAVLGGRPSGRAKITIQGPNAVSGPAIYVVLPPPGQHQNTRRYGIAIVAEGYDGILTSSSTRIPGLVSVTDIAQTAQALAEHEEPVIRSHPGNIGDLRGLDRRLARVHQVRAGALGIAAGVLALLGTIGFLLRIRLAARMAILFGAATVAASLVVSGADIERVAPVLLTLAGISIALAAGGSALPRAPVVAGVLGALLLVLALDTSINSFGPLGPHPEGGGRFYGLGNLEETLLLAPVLAAAAGGSWLLPIGVLTLVTIGWSHAGADGGGMLVFAVALAVLWLRLRGIALTPRRLALVGLDAALGGSSHVTHSIRSGSVFDDIWHRWRLSWAVVTSSWHKGLLFAVSLAGMIWMAGRRDRGPVLEALLVAVVVSLLVNDTPVDVAGIGALGGLALLAWERTRPSVNSRPMRRPLLALPLLALVVAGCGSEGTVRALPETVEGTVQAEAPGKAIFLQQGCIGCHTYKPAGSTATIGPDLDKLPEYAKTAKQPLDAFVRESIVKPGAYIEKGYKDQMPKSYGSLPQSDIDDLVTFLTKPQG